MKTKLRRLFLNKHFVLLLLIASLLRMLWFFTPLELDEGTHLYVSEKWIEGENPYYFNENKSPLLYINYFLPNLTTGSRFIIFRLYGLFFFFVSLGLIVSLIFELNNSVTDAISGGYIYAILAHIPLLQGFYLKPATIFNLYFLLSLVLLIRYFKTSKLNYFHISSVFYSIGIFSNNLNLVYFAFFNLILIYYKKKSLILKYLIAPTITFIIILGSFLFYHKSNFMITGISLLNRNLVFIRFSHFHNWTFPGLYLTALVPIIFLIVFGLLNIKKLNFWQKSALIFTTIFLIIQSLLPTYGHYIVSFFPLIALFGSRTCRFLKTKKLALALVLILTLFFSTKYYPNMNIPNRINFHDFSSYSEQKEAVKFVLSNVDENQSFYYWGWNPGIYWLSNKDLPHNGTDFMYNCIQGLDSRILDKFGTYDNYINSLTSTEKRTTNNFLIISTKHTTECNLFKEIYTKRFNTTHNRDIGRFSIYDIKKS